MSVSILFDVVPRLYRVMFGFSQSQYRIAASAPPSARMMLLSGIELKLPRIDGPVPSALLCAVPHRTLTAPNRLPLSMCPLRVLVAMFPFRIDYMSYKIPVVTLSAPYRAVPSPYRAALSPRRVGFALHYISVILRPCNTESTSSRVCVAPSPSRPESASYIVCDAFFLNRTASASYCVRLA